MTSVRGGAGGLKAKKKVEKKVDQNVPVAAGAAPMTVSSSSSSSENPQQFSDWWDEFSKRISGLLSQSEDKTFECIFRMSRKTFDYICSLVKEDLMSRQSRFSDVVGRRLSLNDLVAIALRRLSSGESLSNIGDSFGVNQSTVSQITWRFVESMEERGLPHLRWPHTETDTGDIKSKFEKIQGLPNCCGAIGITHVLMNLPGVDSSNEVWLDHQQNYSMILQAIVDPDLKFRDIIAGWPGSLSDDVVLKSSGFFKLAEQGKRLNGKRIKLSETTEIGEYIVGGRSYPPFPWLLTPYRGKPISDFQAEFNKRLSKTKRVAAMAFAKLKEMWRIIRGVMWMPDKNRLPRIVFVCCLLHNITIDLEDEVVGRMPFSYLDHDNDYRSRCYESADETASALRDELSHYLS